MVGVPPADGNNRVLGHSLVPRLPFGLTIDRPLFGCTMTMQQRMLSVKKTPGDAVVSRFACTQLSWPNTCRHKMLRLYMRWGVTSGMTRGTEHHQ